MRVDILAESIFGCADYLVLFCVVIGVECVEDF